MLNKKVNLINMIVSITFTVHCSSLDLISEKPIHGFQTLSRGLCWHQRPHIALRYHKLDLVGLTQFLEPECKVKNLEKYQSVICKTLID